MKRQKTLTVRGSDQMSVAELTAELALNPGIWHRVKKYRDPSRGQVFADLLSQSSSSLVTTVSQAGVLQARIVTPAVMKPRFVSESGPELRDLPAGSRVTVKVGGRRGTGARGNRAEFVIFDEAQAVSRG